jgi:SAM-dependent methyltransferase
MRNVVIDIGCGDNKHPGSLGIDRAPLPSVDLLADISRGLPLQDSTVDSLHASHVLEHFDDLVGLMDEIWRVCKPGARVYVTVPHASSSYLTWRDPTHRRGMTLSTFSYFDRATHEGSAFAYYSKAHFQREHARLRFVPGGHEGRSQLGRKHAARAITFTLEWLANRTPYAQHICERWWGGWFGIAEAYAVLRAVK